MTATLPPLRLRTLDQTRELPTPSDTTGWTADQVWRIAMRMSAVSPAAHTLAHPRPVHDCPYCPPVEGEAPNRGSEQYVRELAARPVSWGTPTGAAA